MWLLTHRLRVGTVLKLTCAFLMGSGGDELHTNPILVGKKR